VCVGGQADGRRSVGKPRGTGQVKSSQDVHKQQHHAPNICPAYLVSQTHTRSRPRMHSLAPARRRHRKNPLSLSFSLESYPIQLQPVPLHNQHHLRNPKPNPTTSARRHCRTAPHSQQKTTRPAPTPKVHTHSPSPPNKQLGPPMPCHAPPRVCSHLRALASRVPRARLSVRASDGWVRSVRLQAWRARVLVRRADAGAGAGAGGARSGRVGS
jgi:hypothetical protein